MNPFLFIVGAAIGYAFGLNEGVGHTIGRWMREQSEREEASRGVSNQG